MIGMFNNLRIQFVLACMIVLIISCNNSQDDKLPAGIVENPISADGKGDLSGLPMINFEESEHDFGRVIQGEVVTYAFKFINTGASDLLISNVSSSCGCTVTKYSKERILPEEEGYVQVTFNSSGRKGFQSKKINVYANTQPKLTSLTIKAQVELAGN